MRTIGTCAPTGTARQHIALRACGPHLRTSPAAPARPARDAVGWLTFRSDCSSALDATPLAAQRLQRGSDKAWSCGMGYINF
jgi:hypothetical protein